MPPPSAWRHRLSPGEHTVTDLQPLAKRRSILVNGHDSIVGLALEASRMRREYPTTGADTASLLDDLIDAERMNMSAQWAALIDLTRAAKHWSQHPSGDDRA